MALMCDRARVWRKPESGQIVEEQVRSLKTESVCGVMFFDQRVKIMIVRVSDGGYSKQIMCYKTRHKYAPFCCCRNYFYYNLFCSFLQKYKFFHEYGC